GVRANPANRRSPRLPGERAGAGDAAERAGRRGGHRLSTGAAGQRPGAEALLPGGSVTALRLPGGARPVIARGSGSHLWDTAGHEYLDYLLGSGPLILGHAHPEVTEAAARQAALGTAYYTISEPVL